MNKQGITIAAMSAAAVCTFGVLFAVNGCGKSSGGGGSVLAVVNGEEITTDAFHKYLETKETVRVVTNNGFANAQVAGTLASQGLQDMIFRQVTFQLAKDEDVYPTEAEISKELEFQRKLDPDFLNKLSRTGLTIDRVKQSLMLRLARENLLTKGVTVTMAEAEDYIKSNPQQFTEPAKAAMLWVFVKTADKREKVDEAIRSGQTFSVIAAQHSEFPGAREQGGRFPQQVINQFEPKLQKMVNETPEGKATGWLTLTDGFAKFFVEKKTPAKPIEMTSYRKELVRRELAQRRGAQAIDLGKRILEKLVKSKVDVKERSLTEAWNRDFERYKSEQKIDVPTGGAGDTKAAGTP